jgi:hypothetical protein
MDNRKEAINLSKAVSSDKMKPIQSQITGSKEASKQAAKTLMGSPGIDRATVNTTAPTLVKLPQQ